MYGYHFHGLELDLVSRRLKSPSGSVTLPNGQFRLLLALVQAGGSTVSREQLVELTRRHEDAASTLRSIDVQITRLRRTLGDDAAHPRFILTEQKVGYRFAPEVESRAVPTAPSPG